MNILLIVPPYRTTDALTNQLYPMPLGLVSIGTVLKQRGHSVTIKDFLLPAQVSPAPRPRSFVGTHNPPYRHYGATMDECLRWLADSAPHFDAVGMNMGQCNVFETGAAIGQYITQTLCLPLVIGGPFVTTSTQEALDLTGATVAVQGEGEEVAEEAFRQAFKKWPLANIILEGRPVPMDKIPLPDWGLAPPVNYPRYDGHVRGVLTVSRGCPNNCTFCSVHTVMGHQYRFHSYERIVDELANLARYGVEYYCFLDDNLLLTEQNTTTLFDAIRWTGSDRFRYYMEEGMEVRMAALPQLAAQLKALHFDNIAIGLETLNETQRFKMHKPYTTAQLIMALHQFKQAGVTPKAFYIIGFPDDTVESVCKDIVSFGTMGLAARPNNLKLYPGTAITKQYLDKGWIKPRFDWRLSGYYTPTSTGLNYGQIRRLKTVLGAVGFMAETFGIRMFADNFDNITEALAARRFNLLIGGGIAILKGKFFRPTPFVHMMGMMLMRQGASGYMLDTKGSERLVVRSMDIPADEIQGALSKSIKEVYHG